MGALVDDPAPNLGGDLDLINSSIITTASRDLDITVGGNGDLNLNGGSNSSINLTPAGTGWVYLDGQRWPAALGAADQVLSTTGAGALSWVDQTAAGVNSISATLPLTKTGTTAVTLDINNATVSLDGAMSSTDKTKLDGIEANADKTDATNVAAAGALTEWEHSFTIELPTDADEFSWFFTNKAITATELRLVTKGTTPSTGIILYHALDRSHTAGSGATTIVTQTVTSTTTGHSLTSFDDATIPADSFVWIDVGTVTGTVTTVSGTMFGTKD
jgi:hypothetical protein